MSNLLTQKDMLVTAIDKIEDKNGLLIIYPLGYWHSISLSPVTIQTILNTAIRYGYINKKTLELAIRRIEYKEG